MRKLIIILIIFAPASVLPLQQPYFKIAEQSLSGKSSSNYSVTVKIDMANIEPHLFQSSKVPITTERYILYGTYPRYLVHENNTLFGMIDIDFNKDGDTYDSFKLSYTGKKYLMGTTPLKILQGKREIGESRVFVYLGSDNSIRDNRLSENGKSFIVYSLDYRSRNMIIGFNAEGAIPLETFPNPNIQMLLCKTVPERDSTLKYSFTNKKNYTAYTNEQIFEDQGGDWVGIKWIVLPLDIKEKRQILNLTITGIQPPFALLSHVNYSPGEGLRFRGITSKNIIRK